MNTDRSRRRASRRSQPALEAIAGLKNPSKLPALIGELGSSRQSPAGFFNFGVGAGREGLTQQIAEIFQGGLSLPDRDYYIVDRRASRPSASNISST